jgi:hypothetical protein
MDASFPQACKWGRLGAHPRAGRAESSAGSGEGPTVRVVCAGAARLGLLLALAVTVTTVAT